MVAIILFGIVLLACTVVVVRLARDARIDADSEQDVFERRAQARQAAVQRVVAWWQARVARREQRVKRAQLAQRQPAVPRVEAATVRFTPVVVRRDRDQPTIPAMSAR